MAAVPESGCSLAFLVCGKGHAAFMSSRISTPKIFIINLSAQFSNLKSCCFLLFFENCKILENFRKHRC